MASCTKLHGFTFYKTVIVIILEDRVSGGQHLDLRWRNWQ